MYDYDNVYIDHVNEWVYEQIDELTKVDEVNEIIERLYENPFDTEVDLRSISFDQCERLTPLLKI